MEPRVQARRAENMPARALRCLLEHISTHPAQQLRVRLVDEEVEREAH